MVMNTMGGPDGTSRGAIYIVYGSASPVSLNFGTQQANVTIIGHADGDYLTVQAPL